MRRSQEKHNIRLKNNLMEEYNESYANIKEAPLFKKKHLWNDDL